MRGRHFGFNNPASLSGLIGLARDLGVRPADLAAGAVQTGSHRESIKAVSAGDIDVAAIDCQSWALARQHEVMAGGLVAAGWTALRPGLPYVTSRQTDRTASAVLTAVLIEHGCFAIA